MGLFSVNDKAYALFCQILCAKVGFARENPRGRVAFPFLLSALLAVFRRGVR